ncbi:MAG: 4,5-DOPA dioxygenase extradiol [Bacteroidota bacterium]
MKRKDFIKTMLGATGALSLGVSLKSLSENLKEEDYLMPVLFVGHGSPMNAIEDNEFTKAWKSVAGTIPKPKVILCVSAHWLTKGTFVTAMPHPETIHDFGGFPKALFDVEYPAPGSPSFAKDLVETISSTQVGLDQNWGLDHGTWSVVRPMYPDADIPVLQLSIDYYQPGAYHYALAKELSTLRKKGVLIIGSGNMVHNLGMADFSKMDGGGFDWAIEMNEIFKKLILEGNHVPLMNYESLGKSAKLAIPTPDHYYPLLYTLALQNKNETATFFNDKAVGGSLTMTSVRIG